MIPKDFIGFSQDFEVGFLSWIDNGRPSMARCEFKVSKENITLKPFFPSSETQPLNGSKITLTFSNHLYAEKCKMGIISGQLNISGNSFWLDPFKVLLTFDFDLETYPDRLVKTWQQN